MVAAALYAIAGTVLRQGPMRMLAAAVAAQPALLFGYALWGGIKEMVAAALVALLAGLVTMSLSEDEGPTDSDLVLMGVASAATIAVLSASGGVWLLGVLVPAAFLVARRHGARLAARAVALVALCAGALSAPLIAAGGFVPPTSSPVTSDTAKGNLVEPLSWLQVFGVWPRGDFRYEPHDMTITYLLIAAVAVLAMLGVVLAWRRRAHGVYLFVGGTAAACAVIVAVGSPWVDAKALATASPAILFAALVAAGALGPRVLGVGAALLVCGGVLWSNALAYHEVNLDPRDRHEELERIGDSIAGQGPALMTEYEPYGVRHFLRKADAEGASELRRRVVPLRAGGSLRKLATADIDEFQLDGIRAYRTLVLRRSPIASRPPSVYRLKSRGRFYDVWQLAPELQDSLLEHEPLGRPGDPTARAACGRVRALARRAAAAGARLAVSRLPRAVRMDLAASASAAGGTRPVARMPGAVFPGRRASFTGTVRIADEGVHQVYVGGAFRRQLELSIDGRRVATRRHRLNHAGYHEPLGEARLTAGRHRIDVRYRPVPLAPGDGGPPFAIGPLYVVQSSNPRVELVAPTRARRLCGQRLDWMESVAR